MSQNDYIKTKRIITELNINNQNNKYIYPTVGLPSQKYTEYKDIYVSLKNYGNNYVKTNGSYPSLLTETYKYELWNVGLGYNNQPSQGLSNFFNYINKTTYIDSKNSTASKNVINPNGSPPIPTRQMTFKNSKEEHEYLEKLKMLYTKKHIIGNTCVFNKYPNWYSHNNLLFKRVDNLCIHF